MLIDCVVQLSSFAKIHPCYGKRIDTIHFGEHITIDGYGGDPKLLNDRETVLGLLTELCETQRMTPLIEPVVVEAADNQIKDPGGWSGFLIIAESHISIHTFPRRRFLSADLYTCQNGLDAERIVSYIKERFSLEEVETNFIKRGLRYPSYNLV
ncbi:MAG TPA: adenosylmethionine decarboxylase [Candidatus Paceibacterota bacterium]